METRQKWPVVLVDDEEDILFGAEYLLNTHGITTVTTLGDGRELLPLLERQTAGVIVLDLFMPHVTGQELLPRLTRDYPEIPVVVMTASQEVETAVSCMKEGAFDYLVKPVEESRFVSSVRRALEIRLLRQEIGSLRSSLMGEGMTHPEAFAAIISRNHRMQRLFRYAEAIADSGEPVLITGETGTGKELIAEAIHRLSGRGGELVCLNAAGLDDNLFSDTLFGHVRGAFTGAEREREGLIAKAAGGTLFLDEIGDLKPASQVKLLRLLQAQNYYPIGSDMPRTTDARILAATNQALHRRMDRGKFRQDLYFRLSSHPIELPPLRERLDDLPLLLQHFINEAAQALGRPAPRIPGELLTLLSLYDFPGNIRELRALVFNAMAQHRVGGVLAMDSFQQVVRRDRASVEPVPPSLAEGPGLAIPGRFPSLKEADIFLVEEAMRRANHNQGLAAMLLGISRQSLNRRLHLMNRE
ncbi:MAG: sigma-54-dependent Fis family transcriptional regulator [Chromatiaceae bacterium]|jgi:two-component system response regulator HydG|nr:sigma-54-dependent Fis family transcriptional regulator [Chromatiaceae bacterium]MBP6242719.1 sigma-54-dependent Fis family transcriptional regulator [Chromatiaceae bacterium]MBP7983374.1 sigma-54-dependent Fis family transcriptional regulator [Chromatiaceae bacterium]MBP8024069.1 sigma-54-dependent Fis family transcriptional regulator [Chromatiaceae bacterium]MBP9603515.1 sigma-54-dependent Fis family transcriptional regulator [Chromatiaceae bacterium]